MPHLWLLSLVVAATGVAPVQQLLPSYELGMPAAVAWMAPHVAPITDHDSLARGAQTSDPSAFQHADSSRAQHPPLFTRRDRWLAGAFAVATVAVMPFDQPITEEFRDPWPQQRAVLHHLADGFNFIGSPGVLVGGVAAYGIGRVTGSRRMGAMGLYSTEAIVVSGAGTGLIKGIAGRARPYLNDNDPDSFVLDRGFHGGDSSFPSGHATAAFATAAVVSGESARWWPNAARVITPAAYGSATLVALARIYSNKHWASDVIMGAGIGTLTGLAVVHFNEAHPHNLLNRWLLGASIAPEENGALIMWTIPTQ